MVGVQPEILLTNTAVDEQTRQQFEQLDCILLSPRDSDYGTALRAAIQQATGEYIITMDADQAPPFDFLCSLWKARENAEIVIGSRYVSNGNAKMPVIRRLFSRGSNFVFSRGLDLQVRDMSSAFRLYKSSVVKNLTTESRDYDVLQEILVKARMEGYQIRELPFQYQSSDPAYARAIRFGWAYFKTFTRLWKSRNSIASADYDARAYNALMPPQRYWQRQRYKIITGMIRDHGGERCLDVGCGSSRIIGALPRGSLALDILRRKLRYARRFGHPTVQGSIFDLPVPDESFPCVLCSQVIEHVPRANVLDELHRVLQPGGFLILGTPDYANWEWRLIEWLYKVLLPQAYADEHITHYTCRELIEEFVSKRGYELQEIKYILRGELILGLRKPSLRGAGR
jgi:ubiquinone/menaquinone biosynthesis C-methylase UbiE